MIGINTFIPYSNFEKSIKCLDYKRLGKQRIEAVGILNTIRNGGGWSNHPAVRMWMGYEDALKHYANCAIIEWVNRGYNNNLQLFNIDKDKINYPQWLGDMRVHISHRANLIRKFSEHYSRLWPDIEAFEGYYWPVEPKTNRSKNINEHWEKMVENDY